MLTMESNRQISYGSCFIYIIKCFQNTNVLEPQTLPTHDLNGLLNVLRTESFLTAALWMDGEMADIQFDRL